MPQWVFIAAWVTAILMICAGFAWRNTNRQLKAVADRRPNPTREQLSRLARRNPADDPQFRPLAR